MLQGKNHFPKMIFLFKLGTRPSGRTDLPLTGPGASQAVQRSFPASLAPPSCLAGCPNLPGASQAVLSSCLPGTSLVPPRLSQMVLSCLPGASLVPRGLSKWSFPARWCLPGASQAVQRSFPAWCLPGVQMLFCSLPGARSTGSSSKGFRGTDSFSKGPRGLATRVDSRFWTGAGFCLRFSTTSMANSPVRGKSWGGPHGRLPVAQAGL